MDMQKDSTSRRLQQRLLRMVQPNGTYYYDTYYGTNDPLLLMIKNALRPKPFLTKLAYGQIVPLPTTVSKGEPLPSFTPSSEALRIVEQLRRDGVVVLPGRYRGFIDHVIAKHGVDPTKYEAQEGYQSDQYVTRVDQPMLNMMVDEVVLQVFGLYY